MLNNDSDSLHRIVYTSQATEPLEPAALTTLVEKAQAFNASRSITGVLLYADEVFVQAIEGRQSDLATLYNRIRSDPRHSSVVTLIDEPLDERRFSDWSMALEYARPGGGSTSSVTEETSQRLQSLLDSESGKDLLMLLQQLGTEKA